MTNTKKLKELKNIAKYRLAFLRDEKKHKEEYRQAKIANKKKINEININIMY